MPFTQSLLKGDRKYYVILIQKDAAFPKNSPWNIAADFDVDMSFSAEQIAAMLWEYETDHHTGKDVEAVAEYLYQYTSGYPYLVSALCKIIDEKLPLQEAFADEHNIWTMEGIEAAVRIILRMKAALFDSMIKHITEYPYLKPKIPKSIIHMLAHIQFKEFHDFFLKRCHCCINLLALPFNSNHPQGFHFIYDFLHIMAFKPSRLVHDVFDL